jgi:hypothetical protein
MKYIVILHSGLPGAFYEADFCINLYQIGILGRSGTINGIPARYNSGREKALQPVTGCIGLGKVLSRYRRYPFAFSAQLPCHAFKGLPVPVHGSRENNQCAAFGKAICNLLPLVFEREHTGRHDSNIIKACFAKCCWWFTKSV